MDLRLVVKGATVRARVNQNCAARAREPDWGWKRECSKWPVRTQTADRDSVPALQEWNRICSPV